MLILPQEGPHLAPLQEVLMEVKKDGTASVQEDSAVEVQEDNSTVIRVAMDVCCAAQHATPLSTAQHPYVLQYNASQV